MALSKEEIKQLQRLIGTKEDGLWGPKSKAALNEFTLSQFEPMTESSTADYNPLFATDRLPVKVNKPEPVADYREDKYSKEPVNYIDALLALKNLESNKPMPRVPSSWVGWASYINSGDRGLLSEFAEADKAWNMKKLEEEEKARQLISNIREKELDRKNAKEIAGQNKSQQSEYNLSKARETLGNLAITRDTLAGQGKDTRMVDNQIQSLVERYPELQMPEAPRYDPTKSVDYKLAKYSTINSKSTNSEEIAEAIEELKKFNAPESGKRLAELELEYDKRIKYEQSEAYVKDLIKAFDVNTGDLDPALANRGYESKHATGGKFKLVKDGKVVKSYKAKKSQSWD